MKRINIILSLILISLFILSGCKSNMSLEPTEDITSKTTNTVIETTPVNDNTEKDITEIEEKIDTEKDIEESLELVPVDIEVYVNNEIMDVQVYKEVAESDKTSPDNLGNLIQALPIMEYLDISYVIDEENVKIMLMSDKYGTTERKYSTEVRIINDELYIAFFLFNLHTDGSMKQEDSSAMYLYTSDCERPDLPATLEECYAMLDDELNDEDIEIIRNSTEYDREGMHFGFGMWIRNSWLYPSQSKLTKLMDEKGVYHIDDMSGIIIEGYYRYLNDEPCTLDDMVSWYFEQFS